VLNNGKGTRGIGTMSSCDIGQQQPIPPPDKQPPSANKVNKAAEMVWVRRMPLARESIAVVGREGEVAKQPKIPSRRMSKNDAEEREVRPLPESL
jgi:hypothetical protein